MQSDFAAAYRASRRQYELGRLAVALRHAAMLTVVVAAVAGGLLGKRALVWLPVTLLGVVLAEWRGGFLMRGARRGLAAGFVSILVPLSVLRPCCGVDAKGMGESCCTMPAACWAVGAVVGLFMGLLVPPAPEERRMEAALGTILGLTSVTITRCSMLFLGEAVGLLGGVMAGVIAASQARAWLGRSPSAF